MQAPTAPRQDFKMIIDVDLPAVHDDGSFISARVSRIVELIREYDPNLEVKWIPEKMRRPDEPAFMITERLRDGREVVAFYVQSEADFNEAVLARIYEGDNSKHDVQKRVDAQNAAVNRIREAKQAEEVAQYADLMRSMITTKKHYYRHDGKKYSL
jgi:hypothetical protein